MKLPRPPFRSAARLPLRLSSSLGAANFASSNRLHNVNINTLPTPTTISLGTLSPSSHRTYGSVSAAQLQFGQPVHETHPHILQPGELTPGITAREYADRRSALADAMTDGGVAVLSAAALLYKSGAVFHPYRQESNFLWLTGWNEGDAVAVIEKTGPKWGDYIFTMFVKRKEPREEQWSGYRNGVDAAEHVFNADVARPIEDMHKALPQILESAKQVYVDVEAIKTAPPGSLGKLVATRDSASSNAPLYPVMNKLRVVKSPAEVANMRRAGKISGCAITDAMRRPWTEEKHLHAFLDYQFIINGCDGPAYIPVIAGGQRANCIHYTVNNNTFRHGEFILVDAGGEYGTYVTDISRTWPVSGKFSSAQRDLYEAVLNVQRSSVSLCRESAHMSLEDIHGITARALVEQLAGIGFNVSMNSIDQLFPHHVGHYIGLDVHDCPGFSRREKLRQGHCVTIEPGVYVPDDERWPKHFRGMGIRIEDSVCVDVDSPYILSTEAVKEIDDIEALRS